VASLFLAHPVSIVISFFVYLFLEIFRQYQNKSIVARDNLLPTVIYLIYFVCDYAMYYEARNPRCACNVQCTRLSSTVPVHIWHYRGDSGLGAHIPPPLLGL